MEDRSAKMRKGIYTTVTGKYRNKNEEKNAIKTKEIHKCSYAYRDKKYKAINCIKKGIRTLLQL